MGLFARARPIRDTALDTVERAGTATRHAAGELAAGFNRRSSDLIESAAGTIRERPVAAVAIVTALAAVAASAATYFACRGRE
jgi:hypothetical protein